MGKSHVILESEIRIIRRLQSHARALQLDHRLGLDEAQLAKDALQEQYSIICGHETKVQMLMQSCDTTARVVGPSISKAGWA